MTEHANSPLDDVRAEVVDDLRWAVVLTRDLPHPPTRVWAALTDPHELARWTPYTADRSLGATGAARLTMVDGSDSGSMDGSVLQADPPRLLEHQWGDDVLQWRLAETDGGTRLTLRHTTTKRDELSSFAAGWHLCLDSLDRVLAGRPASSVVGEAALEHGWAELEAGYREAFAGR